MKKILLLFHFILFAMPIFPQNLTPEELVYSHIGPIYRDSGPYSDPWGKHEGPLRGVPSSFAWENGARPGAWMDHGANEAITAWGQIYEIKGDSPERNVRVQIRNFIAYAYVDSKWVILEQDSENLRAGWYSEDYTSSAGRANSREEPARNGGGRSFEPKVNYNIHFWSSQWPRPKIPSGVEAYYLICEARLIPNTDPHIDLSSAKYLLGVSSDYYTSTTASGHGPWPSLSVTRLTYLTGEWKSFTSYVGGDKPGSEQMYRNDISSRPYPPGVNKPEHSAVYSDLILPLSLSTKK